MFILINSTGYVITCRCPIPPSWTILVFCKIITISWWLFDFWFLIHNRLLVKRERVTDTEEILGYRITVGRLYWWGRGRFWIVAGAGRTSTGEYGIQQHWDIHVVVLQVAKYFLHVLYKQDSTYTVLGWSFEVFPSCNCFVWNYVMPLENAILFICSIVQPSSVCIHINLILYLDFVSWMGYKLYIVYICIRVR